MKKPINSLMLVLGAIAAVEAIVIGNMLATQRAGVAAGVNVHAEKPYKAEAVEGSALKRLTLTEKAVERIGLKTAPLGEEEIVMTRVFSGEVRTVPANAKLQQVASLSTGQTASDAGLLSVRVDLGPDLSSVAPRLPARVKRLDDDDDDEDDGDEIEASPLDAADDEDDDAAEGTAPKAKDSMTAIRYFLINAKNHGLAAGERVAVTLAATDSGKKRMVVPYSAVIFDTKAHAWIYEQTAPMTYLRREVVVDTVVGDKAVLQSGPQLGTPIVTIGVAELWGAETGMGK